MQRHFWSSFIFCSVIDFIVCFFILLMQVSKYFDAFVQGTCIFTCDKTACFIALNRTLAKRLFLKDMTADFPEAALLNFQAVPHFPSRSCLHFCSRSISKLIFIDKSPLARDIPIKFKDRDKFFGDGHPHV